MTIEKLKAVYDTQPFRPFTIHLADGRKIPVAHRDFMMTVPKGRTVVVAEPSGALHILDLLLVTDLEIKPSGNRAKGQRGKAS